MARRNDHSREELKTLILETAWTITGLEGFEALTARKLADQIGYTPGTLYNVFTSMDDLYLALCMRVVEKLGALLWDPACHDPKATPAQNIKTMARSYRAYALDNRHHWMLLFGHTLPDNVKPPAWYGEKVALLFVPLEKVMAPAFAADDKRGVAIAARILWSSVHGLCFLEVSRKIPFITDHATAEEMMDIMIDSFIAGLEKA